MIEPAPVVVVGAGIGGLTAARALQQARIPVRVFEHRSTVRGLGAGITLWPNALAVLDRLGLGATVRQAGIALDGGAVRRADGTVLRTVDGLGALLGEPALCIRRDALIAILYESVAPETVLLGKLVTGFAAAGRRDSSRPTRPLEVLVEGRVETPAAVVIGADGSSSAIAKQLHPNWHLSTTGSTAWRGIASLSLAQDNQGHQALESWGVQAEFGALPLTDTTTYWFATANLPPGVREGSAAQELAVVRRRFADWHTPIPDILAATEPSSVLRHDLEDRSPRCWWGQGSVTLLGDAAHPVRPHLGQGACLAIEDAWALASCLRGHEDATTALREYERSRRRRAWWIWAQSGLLGELIHARSTALRWVRDTTARTMPSWQQRRGLQLIAAPP